MPRTRTITVICKVTWFTDPATGTMLTMRQENACVLSNTPIDRHEATLVERPFTAPSIMKADDLGWAYRRSVEFPRAITAAAAVLGIPDPVAAAHRDFYLYDVQNSLTD